MKRHVQTFLDGDNAEKFDRVAMQLGMTRYQLAKELIAEGIARKEDFPKPMTNKIEELEASESSTNLENKQTTSLKSGTSSSKNAEASAPKNIKKSDLNTRKKLLLYLQQER